MTSSAIIVPCYNEARRLDRQRFAEFAAQHADIRFVMVNDGSTDDTLDHLLRLHRKAPGQFEVMTLGRNGGKAEAVRLGMLQALTRSPQYVGFWDADLATPLAAIPEFLGVLESRSDIDLVIGTRMSLMGRQINRHMSRRLIGRLSAAAASLALRQKIRDTQCGAKMFRVTPDIGRVFQQPLVARWIFDVELFARLILLGKMPGNRPFSSRLYELPLARWDEIPGSKIRSADFLRAGLELGSIWWHYFGPFAPATLEGERPDSAPGIDPPTRRAA